MNTLKTRAVVRPRDISTSFGRLAPLCRRDIMPAAKSCTAPPMMLPIGMMMNTISPNSTPRITPMTGPTPAMFSS